MAAFDLGSRRIGVAVTDATGSFVSRRDVLRRRNLEHDRAAVGALLDAYPRATVVIGLPLRADDTEGEQARRTRRWSRDLFEGRPERIVFRDERLTTSAAAGAGADRATIDARAAELLLLDYLREPEIT